MATLSDRNRGTTDRFHASSPETGFSGLARSAGELMRTWHRRARSRREMASMDQRILSDIGIDRAAWLVEMNKPFWRS